MAKVIAPKNFYNRPLPNTETTLYVVPSGKRAIIRNMIISNGSGTTRIVNLKSKSGNNYAYLIPFNFQLKRRHQTELDKVITLDSGDRITGSCDLQNTVTLKISGVEEEQ